jgi:hypothetical protein
LMRRTDDYLDLLRSNWDWEIQFLDCARYIYYAYMELCALVRELYTGSTIQEDRLSL